MKNHQLGLRVWPACL